MHRWRLAGLGLVLVAVAAGCPLERAKKVGFFDRAMAKDTREQWIREGCAVGEHRALPGEPAWEETDWRCVRDIRCPSGQHPAIKASCSQQTLQDCVQECVDSPR